jgi:hypothetical protein
MSTARLLLYIVLVKLLLEGLFAARLVLCILSCYARILPFGLHAYSLHSCYIALFRVLLPCTLAFCALFLHAYFLYDCYYALFPACLLPACLFPARLFPVNGFVSACLHCIPCMLLSCKLDTVLPMFPIFLFPARLIPSHFFLICFSCFCVSHGALPSMRLT